MLFCLQYCRGLYVHISQIAGGTGLTPLIQLLSAASTLKLPSRVTLLYATSSSTTSLLPLLPTSAHTQLTSHEHFGRLRSADIQKFVKKPQDSLNNKTTVVVCGPEV